MSPKLIFLFLYIAFEISRANASYKWTNFKTRYTVHPLTTRSKYDYQTQPKELTDLEPGEWIRISGSDCRNDGKYNGLRYMERNEKGLVLLFDVQGTIAGIQQILNKAEIERHNQFKFDKVPAFNPDTLNGEDVYVITVYFVDPEIICTTGRPSLELTSIGTGTLIRIQSGSSPSNVMVMPRSRSHAIADGWTKTRCFPGMGYHNFYKVENLKTNNCSEMCPVFGLYDFHGNQIGFGFFAIGKANSNHFEHPSPGLIEKIFGENDVPECLVDSAVSPGITAMHVYFSELPQLNVCMFINRYTLWSG